MDLSPTTIGSTAFGGAVIAVLAAIAGRYFVPKWIAARERFEKEITEQLQGLIQERAHLLREQSAENRRLQERMDTADQAIRMEMLGKDAVLRDLWHAEADRFNVAVGKAMARTEENARNIDGIYTRLKTIEDRADERHEKISDDLHKLDVTITRLASGVENLIRKSGNV
jgi:hypothetical protein